MSEKINHKGWRGEDRSGKFHKHFLTHLSKKNYSSFTVTLTTEAKSYLSYGSKIGNALGWLINCVTLRGFCGKSWQAHPLCLLHGLPTWPSMHIWLFRFLCKAGSKELAYIVRENWRFFFRLLTDPFLNKDIQVSSLSNSESTVTVAGAFPTYRNPDDSIDMLFNIDQTTPEVYPPISSLSYCDFSKCPGESVKPHYTRLSKKLPNTDRVSSACIAYSEDRPIDVLWNGIL